MIWNNHVNIIYKSYKNICKHDEHFKRNDWIFVFVCCGLSLSLLLYLLGRTWENLCKPCRMWSLPPREPQVSEETPVEVGQKVEADYKFYRGTPIWHLIDRAHRFRNGSCTPDRSEESVWRATATWFRPDFPKIQPLFSSIYLDM